MDTVKLSITEREQTGNGPARRLRADGRLPGVVYAKGTQSKSISVDVEEFRAAMHKHGHNVVLELDPVDAAKSAKGKKKAAPLYAVVKEFQFHPVKRHLLHVDFHEVDLAVEIEGTVSIELTGTPAGAADGGIVDWELREVSMRALPSDMPEAIELDISGLLIGHHLTVGALQSPTGTKILDDPEVVVVTVVPPRIEEAAPEAVEPEVIGAVKSEE